MRPLLGNVHQMIYCTKSYLDWIGVDMYALCHCCQFELKLDVQYTQTAISQSLNDGLNSSTASKHWGNFSDYKLFFCGRNKRVELSDLFYCPAWQWAGKIFRFYQWQHRSGTGTCLGDGRREVQMSCRPCGSQTAGGCRAVSEHTADPCACRAWQIAQDWHNNNTSSQGETLVPGLRRQMPARASPLIPH